MLEPQVRLLQERGIYAPAAVPAAIPTVVPAVISP